MKPLSILFLDEEQYLTITRTVIFHAWLVIIIDITTETFRIVKNRYTDKCFSGTLKELNEFDFARLFQ